MKDSDTKMMAVLTGDIVGSRKVGAPDPRGLAGILQAAAKAARAALPRAELSAIDIFRGDSWQVLVRRPREALRVVLFLRAYLQGGEGRGEAVWMTRVGIGLGSVEFLDPKRISRSQGPAFVASGQALDDLSGDRRRLALRCDPSDAWEPSGRAVVALLDALARRWTSKQAWAVCGALHGLTQETIAAGFVPEIGRRTAGDHLERADWDAVEVALRWWEESEL